MEAFSVLLDAFNQTIGQGAALAQQESLALWGAMAILGSLLVGGKIATGGGGPALSSMMGGMVRLGLAIVAIQYAVEIADVVLQGFTGVGLLISGSNLSAQQFLNSPAAIAGIGEELAAKIAGVAWEACQAASYFNCLIENPEGYLWVRIGGFIVWACFWVLGYGIFAAVVMFKIGFVCGMILLPLFAFKPLESQGWAPMAFAFRFGVQIMLLSVIAGITEQVFTHINEWAGEMTIENSQSIALVYVAGALAVAALAFRTTVIAQSLAGHAMLSASGLVGGMVYNVQSFGRTASGPVSSIMSGAGSAAGRIAGAAGQIPSAMPASTRGMPTGVSINPGAWRDSPIYSGGSTQGNLAAGRQQARLPSFTPTIRSK